MLFLSSARPQHSNEPNVYEVDDAYDVYSVLLPHEESFEFAKGTLVIRQETVSNPDKASVPCVTADAARRFKDAIADYNGVNRSQWLLQRRFQIDKPYEIVSSDTISLVFKEADWDTFYARYPKSGGYIVMSAVGFDKDRTLAVVYTGSSCGGLCGRWGLHLLRKLEGKWKVVPGVTCASVS